MGGVSGVVCLDGQPDGADREALGEGSVFAGEGATFCARPRSTLARSESLVVMVAGHFDRAPATGLAAADVLLEAWERDAASALDRVEGTWVAAVWERRTRRLHILRDPFGVRRIFWAREGGRFAFASSLRGLLRHRWVRRELARENLAEYLSFRYVHAPRTLLRDVFAVPAGHRVSFDGTDVRTAAWFRLKYSAPWTGLPKDDEALAELERRLTRAVAARASARERVGVFLSGGLDSSALAWVASRLATVHTFTLAVEDSEEDETAYAGRVATILRTHHEVVRVTAGDFAAALPEVVRAADQPLTDPAAVPQALLSRAAATEVDVALCGDGGDEIFGGRMAGHLAGQLRLSTWLRRLPVPASRAVSALFGGRRPELAEPGVPFGLARKIGGVVVFDRHAREALLRDPGWTRAGIRRVVLEPLYREVVSDPVNEILHVYLRGRMPEDALTRAGVAASMADLGVRSPLLDRDLVSWCAGVPGPWKVRSSPAGAITKWPLREILRPILGRTVVYRPKRILPGPWRRWFAGPLRAYLAERVGLLQEDPLRLFLPGAVGALAARAGDAGADAQIWTLILLDAWARDLGVT
jgi:asparagine synthase (glutamine-hydrolysing)